MAQFDLKVFLNEQEQSVAAFKKAEENQFPEHALMLMSTGEINRHFKERLDEVKHEHGFIPEDVYISSDSDGRVMSVDLGATLRGMEVIFHPWVDVRQRAEKPGSTKANGVVSFSFEREIALEYNRCTRLFEQTYRQLKSAWSARDVSQGERELALRFIDETRSHALQRMSMYRQTQASNAAKKHTKAELQSLNFLEARLKMLDPRRTRP